MTPACAAMLASLERTYGVRQVADARHEPLAEAALEHARMRHRSGFKGEVLTYEVAVHMHAIHWANTTKQPAAVCAHAAREIELHWIPAAGALIAAARVEKSQRQEQRRAA